MMSLLLALCFCFGLLFCGYGLLTLVSGSAVKPKHFFWHDVVAAKNYFVGLVLLLLVLSLGQLFELTVGFCLLTLLPLLLYGLARIQQVTFVQLSKERSDPPTRLVGEANQRVERSIVRRLVQPVFIRSMKEGKQDTLFQLLSLLVLLVSVFYLWSNAQGLPLLTWDSWIGWELKARQWLAHGWSVQLVNYAQWPQQQEAIFNTTANYPNGLSLLYYLAHLSGLDYRSVMTVICLFSYFILLWSLCLRLLQNSASPLLLLFAWLLFFQLPLLNTHLILQGYADVWVAMLLVMAVLSLSDWNQNRQITDAVACLLLLFGLLLFKNEGMIWLALLLLAQLFGHFMARRHRIYLLGLGLAAVMLWFVPSDWSYSFAARTVVIGQHYLKLGSWISVNLTPHDVNLSLLHGLFFQNNWGALYLSLPFMIFCWLFFKYPKHQQISQTFFVLASCGFLLLFFMTDAANWAKDFTAVNRIVLQLTPCYIYLLLQSMLKLSSNGKATSF